MEHQYAKIYDRLNTQPHLQEAIRERYYQPIFQEIAEKTRDNYTCVVGEFEFELQEFFELQIEKFYDDRPDTDWINTYIEGDIISECMVEEILKENPEVTMEALHTWLLH